MASLQGSSAGMKSSPSPVARFYSNQEIGKSKTKVKRYASAEGKELAVSRLKGASYFSSPQYLVASIADYGLKLSNHSSTCSEPLFQFHAELEKESLEHCFKEHCISLIDAFQNKKMRWMACCRSIEELYYSKIALTHFASKSSASPPKNQKFASSFEFLKDTIELLSNTISSLENMAVHEAPDLSYSELQKYESLFQEWVAKSSAKFEVKWLAPEEIDLPYAVTLDLEHRRFFVHLKKEVEESPLMILEARNVYEALMVTERTIERVRDFSFDWMAFNFKKKEIELMHKFSQVPFIEDPPLAIVEYEEKEGFILECLKDKVSLLCRPFFGDFWKFGEGVPECSKLETFVPLLCDVAKGISALHKRGYIHGEIALQSFFAASGPEGGTIGVVGKLDGVHKIKQNGKRCRAMSSGSGKGFFSMKENRREMSPVHFLSSAYAAPESQVGEGGGRSKKEDIWAFGITVWQCLYGKHLEDSPFEIHGNPSHEQRGAAMTQVDACLSLGKKLPPPKTMQEEALQKIIRQCLYVNPEERIDSLKLVQLFENVLKTEPIPFEKQQSLHNLFHPFTEFEKEIEKQEKRPLSFKLSRRSSLHSVGTQGSLSLPPELFDLFCVEGKLRSHIENVEKLIDETLLGKPASFFEIIDCENGLRGTYHVFDELENKIYRFAPPHSDALINHKKNICEFKLKLSYLQEKVHSTFIEGGEGLTYGEFCEYRAFAELHFKLNKKPAGSIEEGEYIFPLSYHFAKESEGGRRHALTLNPTTNALYIHLKKKNSSQKALGKGAMKSVHAALEIQGYALKPIADIVVRINDEFHYVEEKLKQNFKDCPYIEKPAYAITIYEKEEIPGFWSQKEGLEPEKLAAMKQTAPKCKVRKVAFLCPQYFCSLSALSYEMKGARNVPLLVKLLSDALLGLAYMHENGYLHRDLNPGNIYVKRETGIGEPILTGVIGDLGEAVYVGPKGVLSEQARMASTLYYNSPEMCYDTGDIRFRTQSFASDIWAFGVLACQALYGNNGRDIPFLKKDTKLHIYLQLMDLTQEQVDRSLDERFPPPSTFEEQVMQQIIRSCLQINPDLRPSATSALDL